LLKTGADFEVDFGLRKTGMAEKDDDDGLAAALLISAVANRNKKKTTYLKCSLFTAILYYLYRSQTKTMNFNQSQLFLSITCF